jgi:expansin (peptidoglycan-binding protein)
MNGTLSRVYGAYPLAFPLVFSGLAAAYPGTFSHDEVTGLYTIQFTLGQLGAAFAGAYGIVGGVFAKWGIKR